MTANLPPLWTADAAAEATGGQTTRHWTATGVSIDTRTLEPGDLFIALKGPNFDGHTFIRDALDKGASAAIAEHRPDNVPDDAPLLLVNDTQTAIEDLGKAARQRTRAAIVGVTGSAGKTGTKDTLALCLGEQGRTHAAFGSFNNHWGVPLTLARMPADCDYAVFEMGMNHAGELSQLTAQVRPDVAIITTVQAAHIEAFDSVEGIAEAKAEILQGVPHNGTAILPRDNAYYDLLVMRAREAGIGTIFSFGGHPAADIRCEASETHATYSAVRADLRGRDLAFTLALPGAHWINNALAVLAAVEALGADTEKAAGQLAYVSAPARRGERHAVQIPGGSFIVIDDSYNANPASMRAALAVLGTAEGGRRLAALGSMKELGAASAQYHAELAEPIASAGIDLVFTCGPEMTALRAALPTSCQGGHSDSAAGLAPQIAAAVQPGDTVLVKGSAGACMSEIVAALRDPASAAQTETANAG